MEVVDWSETPWVRILRFKIFLIILVSEYACGELLLALEFPSEFSFLAFADVRITEGVARSVLRAATRSLIADTATMTPR